MKIQTNSNNSNPQLENQSNASADESLTSNELKLQTPTKLDLTLKEPTTEEKMTSSPKEVKVSCVAIKASTAPNTNSTYDGDGDKWCIYSCENLDSNERKSITAPGSNDFCLGQSGGDEYSKLKFTDFEHNTGSLWDNFWNPKFSNEIRKAFSSD
ncbi:MAG: hypothetical protein JAZ16_06135 [Candidatus Thiodiazotropha taylori]|nr:hypothetical protein [Candidatus Thiodiazotropha taylori]